MLPHLLLLAAVVIWGWTFVATKILVAEIGPIEVFALRVAIGLPSVGVWLIARRVRLGFTAEDARPLLLGGAVLTLHFVVQIAGIVTTTATNTAWIITASPLALAVLSFLFLRERLGGAPDDADKHRRTQREEPDGPTTPGMRAQTQSRTQAPTEVRERSRTRDRARWRTPRHVAPFCRGATSEPWLFRA